MSESTTTDDLKLTKSVAFVSTIEASDESRIRGCNPTRWSLWRGGTTRTTTGKKEKQKRRQRGVIIVGTDGGFQDAGHSFPSRRAIRNAEKASVEPEASAPSLFSATVSEHSETSENNNESNNEDPSFQYSEQSVSLRTRTNRLLDLYTAEELTRGSSMITSQAHYGEENEEESEEENEEENEDNEAESFGGSGDAFESHHGQSLAPLYFTAGKEWYTNHSDRVFMDLPSFDTLQLCRARTPVPILDDSDNSIRQAPVQNSIRRAPVTLKYASHDSDNSIQRVPVTLKYASPRQRRKQQGLPSYVDDQSTAGFTSRLMQGHLDRQLAAISQTMSLGLCTTGHEHSHESTLPYGQSRRMSIRKARNNFDDHHSLSALKAHTLDDDHYDQSPLLLMQQRNCQIDNTTLKIDGSVSVESERYGEEDDSGAVANSSVGKKRSCILWWGKNRQQSKNGLNLG